MYVLHVYMMKNKQRKKQKAYFTTAYFTTVNDFHGKWHGKFICLSLFCLFFGNIFKVKSSFWYYDVSTSPFLFLK